MSERAVQADEVWPCEGAIVAVDWSLVPGKRVAWHARFRAGRGGSKRRGVVVAKLPAPVESGWTLPLLLEVANRTLPSPVLIAIDAALGVAHPLGVQLRAAGFRDALARIDRAGGLSDEADTPEAWRVQRPFFRVPPGAGGLTRFLDAGGGRHGTQRETERITGAKPMFVLSGIPGTVGSGTRELWRALVAAGWTGNAGDGSDDGDAHGKPVRSGTRMEAGWAGDAENRNAGGEPEQPGARKKGEKTTPEASPGDFAVWPFDGAAGELAHDTAPVVAECYPGIAYEVALAERLPAARPRRIAKTRAHARERALDELMNAKWLREHRVTLRDPNPARTSEDDFDALFTALALTRLALEGLPLAHPVDPRFEGGIVGTGGYG